MCSAHRLTKRNILVKFQENQSKGSGDMEQTGKFYGQTDGQRKSIRITPLLLCGRGLKKKVKVSF